MTRRTIPKGVEALPDDLLYQVCLRLLRDGESHAVVTKWLQKDQGLSNATREWPRACLARAYQKGLVTIPPQEHSDLAHKLATKFDLSCRVSASEHLDGVVGLAADQAVQALEQVVEAARQKDTRKKEVHIGISAGGTTRSFATHLAARLEARDNLPKLVFHALTSGFEPDKPMNTPAVTLGIFTHIRPETEFSVLLSEPLVSKQDAPRMKYRPFLKRPYELAKKLDIVVTSLSVAQHPHSLFTTALTAEDPERAERRFEGLLKSNWVGDIMWRPYSDTGEPLSLDIEPVSVVGFQDLVKLSNRANNHVICIAGACTVCSETRTKALLPFIRTKSQRRRPFSYLVTTKKTAEELCEQMESAAET